MTSPVGNNIGIEALQSLMREVEEAGELYGDLLQSLASQTHHAAFQAPADFLSGGPIHHTAFPGLANLLSREDIHHAAFQTPADFLSGGHIHHTAFPGLTNLLSREDIHHAAFQIPADFLSGGHIHEMDTDSSDSDPDSPIRPPRNVQLNQDPHTHSDFLVYSPLSCYWNWSYVKHHPGYIPFLIGMLPFGMVGYALSLPVRITVFVVEAIRLVATLLKSLFRGNFGENRAEIKLRLLMLGGATGELVSGFIGCVLPPLAYKFDEWIQRNRTIHEGYREYFTLEFEGRPSFTVPFSRWYSERAEVAVERTERDDPIGVRAFAENFITGMMQEAHARRDAGRIRDKRELIQDHLAEYRGVKDVLAKFLHDDWMAADPMTLNLIAELGFFRLFLNGISLEAYDISNANRHLRTLQNEWNVLKSSLSKDLMFKHVLLAALYDEKEGQVVEAKRLSVAQKKPIAPLEIFKVGAEAALKNSLGAPLPTDLQPRFDAFYQALKLFSKTVVDSDRDFLMVIGRAAFPEDYPS